MSAARAKRRPAGQPQMPAAAASSRRWMRLAAGLGVLLGAGVAIVWGTRAGAPVVPTRPSVLLITLDTTRADRLGSYGYAPAATPHLDRLAADGVRFERALSPVPLTLPAHASLMTGRNPYAHGVRNNGHFTLPADVPTLAEGFRDAGYDTAAFVSTFVLDRQFGLARGFTAYDDTLDAPAASMAPLELERRGDRTVAAARAWLSARRPTPAPRPYFLWVHLYDPHDPYVPPEPFATTFADRPYDGELAFADAQVGALLESVGYGRPGGPLVVVSGDHGESLGEHGESTHGLFVYDGAIRVPLVVAWPSVLAPRVVRERVRLIDVAPTLGALAGLAARPPADGRDVTALLKGTSSPGPDSAPAYSETLFPEFYMGWAPLRAIDDGRWKFIDAPEPELYDIAADPHETSNRWALEPVTARVLKRHLEETTRAVPERSADTPISVEAQRKLAALGYVSRPASAPAPGASRPDPKRMVARFEQLLDGNRALASGRPEAAKTLAEEVLAADAQNAFARLVLGRALLALDDPRGAEQAFRTYLAAVPASADAHHWLALAFVRQGDRAAALREEDAALAIDSGHAAATALRAGLLFSSGKTEEGLAALHAAVEARPSHPGLRVDYADLLADAGRVADAEGEYQRVLATRPDDVRALAGLGLLQAHASRLEPALATLTRALELDPRHEEARIERAAVYSQLGRIGESRADLEHLTGPAVRPDIRRAAQKQLGELRSKR